MRRSCVNRLDDARRAEQEIRAGNYRGPLHGVPVAVKDLFYTKGVRTMGGSQVHANFIPEYDATVVTRLKESGAVLLGKLNLTEGALSNYNPRFDVPVQPMALGFMAGNVVERFRRRNCSWIVLRGSR